MCVLPVQLLCAVPVGRFCTVIVVLAAVVIFYSLAGGAVVIRVVMGVAAVFLNVVC